MKPLYIVIILLILVILNVILFSIIYENENKNYDESIYLSIQIQTLVGLNGVSEKTNLRTWITIQSVVAYILNILLVAYIGVIILKN